MRFKMEWAFSGSAKGRWRNQSNTGYLIGSMQIRNQMQHCAQAVLFEAAKPTGAPLAIRPRAFPQAAAPRCLCARFSRQYRLQALTRAVLDWGEEGILPSSVSSSHCPHSVSLHLLVVVIHTCTARINGPRSPPIAQPLSSVPCLVFVVSLPLLTPLHSKISAALT